MNSVYIFLADGFEPVEALAPMDILRRGGVDARLVSITENRTVASTQGFNVQANLTWPEFLESADFSGNDGCMIFPGGLPGSDNLGRCKDLMDIMAAHFNAGGLTCAICAAPSRVLAANLKEQLSGRKLTMYKGMEGELAPYGIEYTGNDVQEDGNIITGKGAGLGVAFGLAILSRIKGSQVSDKVKASIML